MKKNKIFFIILIVFAFQLIHSQNPTAYEFQWQKEPNPELILDKDYFLLGTLSDYLGREKTYKNDDFVDNYYKGGTSLMSYIMKIYSDESPEFVVEKNQYPYNSVQDILRSKKISKKMNSFYDFKHEGGFKYFLDPKDKEWRKKQDDYYKSTEPKDTVYVGTMKANLFKTNVQKISFIIGAYSRYGEQKETRYCISLYNSVSKYEYCIAILKQLKCTNIEKKITDNNIPTNKLVYFKPSRELKKYLDAYKFLRL
ncbi:hypothetical protein [Flavobacterium granuli]|uniref:DKNYY family protein n=1 Tax=Flavobacterium granuli TaxID=280093 RepID=A0A1M5PGH0_9FLAO|nr:hypothetical protein [Flavobacterium granuli]PRZ26464.1 hypothetical protein BC624_102437 [Flavobacterium granuli]SHH00549.1 hypothetical protein SAMN05443373_10634 [Flavobacterium granuli]